MRPVQKLRYIIACTATTIKITALYFSSADVLTFVAKTVPDGTSYIVWCT